MHFPLAQTPQPADRGVEILDLIRDAFATKGFDGASMQDLARAAGMSVGNFYRYFPSKAAIVEALVGHDMAEIERKFTDLRTAGDLMAAIRAKIAEQVRESCLHDGRLWAEINAAAGRKPEIAQICGGMEELVTRNLLAVFARLAGISPEASHQRFGAHARFIILMVKTAATRAQTGPDPDLEALILRSIDNILADITPAAAEKS